MSSVWCPECQAEIEEEGDGCQHCGFALDENSSTNINVNDDKDKKVKGEGCFIATACYGSTLAKEVRVLQEFRDLVLKKSYIGNLIINIYYRISPPLANMISHSKFLKLMIRKYFLTIILKIANKLNK